MNPKTYPNAISQDISKIYYYEIRCAKGTDPQTPERDLELQLIKDFSKSAPNLETLKI